MLCDSYNRNITYLRLSITDGCNSNCRYCMPPNRCYALRRSIDDKKLLKIVELLAKLGVNNVRLTGGEPLLKKDILDFIKALNKISGIEKITLTTNGIYLNKMAKGLLDAGISNINIHIDSLRPLTYQWITGGQYLNDVIDGIRCTVNSGLNNTKLNTVLMRGINDHEVINLIKFSSEFNMPIRFIELMPTGDGTFYKKFFVSTSEVLERLRDEYAILQTEQKFGDGPAEYIKIKELDATVGFISHYSKKFCHNCNRLRLSSDGSLKNCLGNPTELKLGDCFLDNDELLLDIKKYLYNKPIDHANFTRYVKDPLWLNMIGG